MKQKEVAIAALLLIFSVVAGATTPPQTHQFHVLGKLKYRCYPGPEGKKMVDDFTKKPCNNKETEKTVIDKVISIVITDEPDPSDSKELAGTWDESFEFAGRKFVIALTLFKDVAPNPYRLRLVAHDNEPVARETAIFSEFETLTGMNPISIDYTSIGKKEEINFSVEVKSAIKK
jgi:hypothetical protein